MGSEGGRAHHPVAPSACERGIYPWVSPFLSSCARIYILIHHTAHTSYRSWALELPVVYQNVILSAGLVLSVVNSLLQPAGPRSHLYLTTIHLAVYRVYLHTIQSRNKLGTSGVDLYMYKWTYY